MRREGPTSLCQFDIYAQALAKTERGHARAAEDLDAIVKHGLIGPARMRECFAGAEPELYGYPTLDPPSFRRAVQECFGG